MRWLVWLACLPAALGFMMHRFPIEDAVGEFECEVSDEAGFKAATSGRGNTLVFFYADHCSFSFAMAPEWGRVCQRYHAGRVGEHAEPMKVLMVNAMKHEALAKEESIYQFPEIRLYRNEENGKQRPVMFVGERTATSIIRWVDHIVDSMEAIKTYEDYTTLLSSHEHSVVLLLFIPPRLKDVEADVVHSFKQLSKREQDAYFAFTRDPAVASEVVSTWKNERGEDFAPRAVEISQTQKPFIAVFNPFALDGNGDAAADLFREQAPPEKRVWLFPDEEAYLLPKFGTIPTMPALHSDGRLVRLKDVEQLKLITREFKVPRVALFTDSSAGLILKNATEGEGAPLLFFVAHEDLLRRYADDIYQLGGFFRSDVQVVLVDLEVSGFAGQKILHVLGIEADEVPLVTLVSMKRERMRFVPRATYRPDFDFFSMKPATAHNDAGEAFHRLLSWVVDYKAGTVTEFLKSEPLPDAEDLSPDEPLPLVGLNFVKEVIEDSTQDVLVDFYAPWCGHCNQFEPILRKVAKYATQVKTLKVAKFDATRNASPGMRIVEFPTVLLFPAKDKSAPRHYAGHRSPEKLLSWINDHASFKFDVQGVVRNHERSHAGKSLLSEQERIRMVLDEL